MDANGNFPPMRVGNIVPIGVDFSDTGDFAPGEIITNVTWYFPNGLAPIGSGSVVGLVVSQQIEATAPGSFYPTCSVDTNLGNNFTLPDPGRGMLVVV